MSTPPSADDPLAVPLRAFGAEVRRRREARGWTLATLSDLARLSPRSLGDLERGKANPTLRACLHVAEALDTRLDTLLRQPASRPHEALHALVDALGPEDVDSVRQLVADQVGRPIDGRRFALVGLRGAGKSTVGKAVAERVGARFVELDEQIEERAGLSLAELFTLPGEGLFAELEAQALEALIQESEPLVLAVGGSLVTRPETYARLRRRFVVCWLHAEPEDHWQRVVDQGDLRPMRTAPRALEHLRALLTERTPLYRKAHHQVETSRLTEEECIAAVEALAWPVIAGA